jgi:type II secretory pathway pseudopilin PulG
MTIASSPRSGLTLADIVVTVLINGIIAALAVPKYAESVEHFQLEASAKHVAADIRHARQHAKVTGSTQSVVFTPSTDSYDLPGMNDLNQSGRPFEVILPNTRYPAALISASFGVDGSSTTVVFDMFGRPDYGGNLVLGVGSEPRTISIDGVSGTVSVQP